MFSCDNCEYCNQVVESRIQGDPCLCHDSESQCMCNEEEATCERNAEKVAEILEKENIDFAGGFFYQNENGTIYKIYEENQQKNLASINIAGENFFAKQVELYDVMEAVI